MANQQISSARVIVGVVAITLVTLFFVWTRLQNIRLKRESARLKQSEQIATLENNRLKLEWARLTSPGRLEELGAQKFQLRRPRPDQIIVIQEAH
jgi:cell division protein FtsL